MGHVISLDEARCSRSIEPEQTEPNPFVFWVELLDDLSLEEQRRIIGRAYSCDVIDTATADTLKVMWSERREGR